MLLSSPFTNDLHFSPRQLDKTGVLIFFVQCSVDGLTYTIDLVRQHCAVGDAESAVQRVRLFSETAKLLHRWPSPFNWREKSTDKMANLIFRLLAVSSSWRRVIEKLIHTGIRLLIQTVIVLVNTFTSKWSEPPVLTRKRVQRR